MIRSVSDFGSGGRVRRLGFAVKVLGDGGLPSHDTRRWQSDPHLSRSLEHVDAIFDYLDRSDIRMYRFASALAPYASHPDMPRFHRQVADCEEELARCGERAAELGIRLSFHPGQYTVLNSERADVQAAAIADLELQVAILNAMGLAAEAVVVIHVGGAAGGVQAGLERFLAGWERLSRRAQARLVVENDDRTFDLAAALWLHERTGIRIVWDALHHRCHNPQMIPPAEALARALDTWPADVVPKIHYSSPRLDVDVRRTREGRRVRERIVIPPLRAHADLVDPIAFEAFLTAVGPGREFDVMLEAKAKDLALIELRRRLAGANS
jgi:UV DNA damage endonuclease